MEKQQATYIPQKNDIIIMGQRAWVLCKEHPRNELCLRDVHTSTVVAINSDGSFETLNTHYKPVTEV